MAQVDPCQVADDGTGTVSLPPEGCAYLSPDEVHMIIDGLPPGTTIELAPIHRDFICKQGGPGEHCGLPGGSLDGEFELFTSMLQVQMTGTGDLSGFSRTLQIPVFCETHTGPRLPGEPTQDFDTDMWQLQGGIFGDDDFEMLQVIGGTANGMPSPGHTTLTRLGGPGSDFQVDSFFDIAYQIEFQGAAGSVLEGLSGTTQPSAPIHMEAGSPGGGPSVPAASTWGVVAMAAVLIGAGVVISRKRRIAVA